MRLLLSVERDDVKELKKRRVFSDLKKYPQSSLLEWPSIN